MTVKEIKEIAVKRGLKVGKMKKADLIKTIQHQEGNDTCFGTNAANCGQMDCLWREDCLKSS